MSILRLLTSESAMGVDVVSQKKAWGIWETFLEDERIGFMNEPFGIEDIWRVMTSRDRPMTKVWTDAYLAAFARAAGMRMVTLDRAMLTLAPDALLLTGQPVLH